MNENYHKIPLSGGAQTWVEKILETCGPNGKHKASGVPAAAAERRDVSGRIKAAGYDIAQMAKQMEEYLYYG